MADLDIKPLDSALLDLPADSADATIYSMATEGADEPLDLGLPQISACA